MEHKNPFAAHTFSSMMKKNGASELRTAQPYSPRRTTPGFLSRQGRLQQTDSRLQSPLRRSGFEGKKASPAQLEADFLAACSSLGIAELTQDSDESLRSLEISHQ